MKRALFVAITAAACWDSWMWYARRLALSPEEAAPLAAAVAVLAGLAWARRQGRRKVSACPSVALDRVIPGNAAAEGGATTFPLLSTSLLLGGYAASHWLLPPIMQCALAVTTVLWTAYSVVADERPPTALWGLAALALPVLPSLQFTLGFPLRASSAAVTATLLQLQGLAVTRQGTLLTFGGRAVEFDAPCSGVAMLWAAMLTTLLAGALLRLRPLKLALALAAAGVSTIVANVLRTAALFYLETGLLTGPAWWHEAVGLAAFAASAVLSLRIALALAPAVKAPEIAPCHA